MKREVRLQTVVNIIADEFGVERSFLSIKSKKGCYTNPKKMLCHVLYKREKFSLEQIAEWVGYKDHTTPKYHVDSVKGMLQSCDDFKWRHDNVVLRLADLYNNASSKANVQLLEEARIKAKELVESFNNVNGYNQSQRVVRDNARILCDERLTNLAYVKTYLKDDYKLFWTVVKEQIDHM